MAKLYFKYGTMNASKSASLLMAAHKYEQQNKNILCLKPSLDTRDDSNFIESRALIYKHKCISFDKDVDLFIIIKEKMKDLTYNSILIDEAQFLTKLQVMQLAKVTDLLNVPVLCYGLKNSYIEGELFEGSKALLYFADSIQEIKSVCQFCNSKATMNLRIKNNKPLTKSETMETVVIGDVEKGDDYFVSTCRKHYFNPEI